MIMLLLPIFFSRNIFLLPRNIMWTVQIKTSLENVKIHVYTGVRHLWVIMSPWIGRQGDQFLIFILWRFRMYITMIDQESEWFQENHGAQTLLLWSCNLEILCDGSKRLIFVCFFFLTIVNHFSHSPGFWSSLGSSAGHGTHMLN